MSLEFRPTAAQRILVNTTATLTSYKHDQYGEIATPGTVTVTVTRGDDTVVDTDAATTGTPQLSYLLTTANNDRLDWLTAVWTDASDGTSWVTHHEIVGGFYASVVEIRARDSNLNDAGTYPASRIRSIMEEIETAFEVECGRAFVPRYRRVKISGNAESAVLLPDVDIRTVRSVWSYSDYQLYTEFTATELATLDWYSSGALQRNDGTWWYAGYGNYVLEYEHGMDRPPADVKAASIRWLRATLNASRSALPDRAAFSVSDGGSYSLIVPGREGAVSGIPEVDTVIERYRVKRFTVGVDLPANWLVRSQVKARIAEILTLVLGVPVFRAFPPDTPDELIWLASTSGALEYAVLGTNLPRDDVFSVIVVCMSFKPGDTPEAAEERVEEIASTVVVELAENVRLDDDTTDEFSIFDALISSVDGPDSMPGPDGEGWDAFVRISIDIHLRITREQ